MDISSETVEYIFNLARLKPDEAQLAQMQDEFKKIADYMDILNELNTDDISQNPYTIPVINVFRDDIPEKSYNRSELLSSAPCHEDEYVITSKAVE